MDGTSGGSWVWWPSGQSSSLPETQAALAPTRAPSSAATLRKTFSPVPDPGLAENASAGIPGRVVLPSSIQGQSEVE
jgi:hypothetical protein